MAIPRSSTLAEALNSRDFKRGFAVVLAVVFAITFLRGLRLPNLYSATQFAFNYSKGFVRRGLVGEIARHLLGDAAYHYWPFVGISFFFLILVAIGIGWNVVRVLRAHPEDVGLKVALLVFAASPGLLVFVHTVGYLDFIGYAFLLVLLLVAPRARSRYLIFYAMIGAGLLFPLIHEGLVVMFAPVMIFAAICHVLWAVENGTPTQRQRLNLIAHCVAASVLVFVLSSFVSTLGSDDVGRVVALRRSIARAADYAIRPDAFEALVRSSRDNVMSLMPEYWSFRENREPAVKSFFAVLPSYAFSIAYGLYAISGLALARLRAWMLRLSFVAASLAPLSLNLVGWDWNRWNGLAVLASFSCTLALKSFFPRRDSRAISVVLVTGGLCAVALSLAADTVLFDGMHVHFYPFEKQWAFIEYLFKRDFQFRPRQ